MQVASGPILAARDRLVRPGGVVIPAAMAMYGVLVESEVKASPSHAENAY
jgi:hypothetical protein